VDAHPPALAEKGKGQSNGKPGVRGLPPFPRIDDRIGPRLPPFATYAGRSYPPLMRRACSPLWSRGGSVSDPLGWAGMMARLWRFFFALGVNWVAVVVHDCILRLWETPISEARSGAPGQASFPKLICAVPTNLGFLLCRTDQDCSPSTC